MANSTFYARLRRHQASPFNAHFYDKEPLTEEIIARRVRGASQFFNLPVPELAGGSDTLASITYTSASGPGSGIHYNMERLRAIGINNGDAFDAVITHELSHQFLSGNRFNFCRNSSWCTELACDFIVGARCRADLIASGKYKYAVSVMKVSASHPGGELRQKAVEAGFDFAGWLLARNIRVSFKYIISGITKFLCLHSRELNEAWSDFIENPPQPEREINIMELPDNNLIKIALLKYKPPTSHGN